MEKKKRILKTDVNEIAFRVVQESTNDDNLAKIKPSKNTKPNHLTTNK
jgi:hypothetical protein